MGIPVISSGNLPEIVSGILPGIFSWIFPGIPSWILPGNLLILCPPGMPAEVYPGFHVAVHSEIPSRVPNASRWEQPADIVYGLGQDNSNA